MKHLGKDMINDLLGVMFGFTAVPAVFKVRGYSFVVMRVLIGV